MSLPLPSRPHNPNSQHNQDLRTPQKRASARFFPLRPTQKLRPTLTKNLRPSTTESATKPSRETLIQHPSPAIAPTGIHLWFSTQTHFEDKTVSVDCI